MLAAQRTRPTIRDDTWLKYPLAIARRRVRDRYQRALEILEEFGSPGEMIFPVQVFQYFATLALISADEGDREDASRWARKALEAAASGAPFPRHPNVGLVGARYADLQDELRRLVID